MSITASTFSRGPSRFSSLLEMFQGPEIKRTQLSAHSRETPKWPKCFATTFRSTEHGLYSESISNIFGLHGPWCLNKDGRMEWVRFHTPTT